MTAETETTPAEETEKNRPTHTVRQKLGHGKQAYFETLGVAWHREDGGFYIKLYGTQLIHGGFYVFPRKDEDGQ